MSLQQPDIADLEFQVGDHVCAFYNGGDALDDIVVDYVSRGLGTGDKCVCFMDGAASVRAQIPAGLLGREDILQFFTEDEAYLSGGAFNKDVLLRDLEAMVKEALVGGYERVRVLGDVSFVVRSSVDMRTWFTADAELNEFAPRYPQFIMCLYDLDLFDGQAVMYVLKTHPRIYVNGLIIPNPHFVPTRQFLGEL